MANMEFAIKNIVIALNGVIVKTNESLVTDR
jgi:hypothetical protein